MSIPGMANTLVECGVRKALDILLSMSVIKSHANLKLLFSRWSVETHAFIVSWGEFTSTLEDVAVMLHLPLLSDNWATDIALSGEDTAAVECCRQGVKEIKVRLLDRYFRVGEGF